MCGVKHTQTHTYAPLNHHRNPEQQWLCMELYGALPIAKTGCTPCLLHTLAFIHTDTEDSAGKFGERGAELTAPLCLRGKMAEGQ